MDANSWNCCVNDVPAMLVVAAEEAADTPRVEEAEADTLEVEAAAEEEADMLIVVEAVMLAAEVVEAEVFPH